LTWSVITETNIFVYQTEQLPPTASSLQSLAKCGYCYLNSLEVWKKMWRPFSGICLSYNLEKWDNHKKHHAQWDLRCILQFSYPNAAMIKTVKKMRYTFCCLYLCQAL